MFTTDGLQNLQHMGVQPSPLGEPIKQIRQIPHVLEDDRAWAF